MTTLIIGYRVEARDKRGNIHTSTHATKEAAKLSAACCKGRYPFGNRVKVVAINESEEV